MLAYCCHLLNSVKQPRDAARGLKRSGGPFRSPQPNTSNGFWVPRDKLSGVHGVVFQMERKSDVRLSIIIKNKIWKPFLNTNIGLSRLNQDACCDSGLYIGGQALRWNHSMRTSHDVSWTDKVVALKVILPRLKVNAQPHWDGWNALKQIQGCRFHFVWPLVCLTVHNYSQHA